MNGDEGPTLPYGLVRSQIRDGDLLLFRGHGLVSRVISRVTDSPYTHVGIAAWWRTRLFLLEFREGKGGRAVWLSREIAGHEVWWARPLVACSREQLHQVVAEALADLGRGYDYRGILRHWLWRRLGLSYVIDAPADVSPYYCSSWVASVFANGLGIDLVPLVLDRLTAPGDIARSPRVEIRCRLTAESAAGSAAKIAGAPSTSPGDVSGVTRRPPRERAP